MKVLKDDQYAELQTAADNWTQMVASFVGANSDVTENTVTPGTIMAAFANAGAGDLQKQLDTVKNELETEREKVSTLEEEKKDLQTQVDNLLDGAGSKPASVKSETELDAKSDSLSAFANQHAGDTTAILAKCKEEGLI